MYIDMKFLDMHVGILFVQESSSCSKMVAFSVYHVSGQGFLAL